MNINMHATEPQTIILKKKRPLSAGPKRPNLPSTKYDSDEIKPIEKPKLDIATRISQARILKGYKTRHDLAKALNMKVDITYENRNYDKLS